MERAIREFELIANVFAPLARSKGALGLKDDVALLQVRAGHDLVLTTDTIVEGIDFLPTDPPDTIARKALRVNLSDLAAKGAEPFGYLLTLMLRKRTDSAWLRKFASGLRADQKKFGFTLLGGDMSGTPGPLSVSVTAFGHVPRGKAILRNGAKPGDIVFVTGTIGDSGGGLAALKNGRNDPFLIERYRLPEPRVSFGAKLRGIASAAIDVSDGLVADLGHIADVSAVHVAIELERLPISKELRNAWGERQAAMVRAATAGDDYEIAFTAPPSRRARVFAVARQSRIAVTEIGSVRQGRGVILRGSDGRPIKVRHKGWEHF